MTEPHSDIPPLEAAVGVLVPSANPAIEPELHRLLPPSVALHAARFPVMPGTTLEQRNLRYLDLYPETIKAFGSLALAGIVIGLTGPSYRLLPEGDIALSARLGAAAGAPVATASRAVAESLAALGARRLCLVSPYPAWLTEHAAAYWRAAGHDVVQVVKISETFRAYELTKDEIAAALARVADDEIDATVMSGTGMRSLPTILAARRTARKPILSSNICCAWWLMRVTKSRSSLLAAAAPELAALL